MTTIVLMGEPAPDEAADNETQVIERSVTMSNEAWSILALCAEAYATTVRTQQSEFVATYVTRGQMEEAVSQAAKMNGLIRQLDSIQAKLR